MVGSLDVKRPTISSLGDDAGARDSPESKYALILTFGSLHLCSVQDNQWNDSILILQLGGIEDET